MTIFRELNYKESSKVISLYLLDDKEIKLQNLLTNKTEVVKLDGDKIPVNIKQPAGFHFLKYEVVN